MILMDSVNELAMNLGETYLVTENGNERLGKQKLDLSLLYPVLELFLVNLYVINFL